MRRPVPSRVAAIVATAALAPACVGIGVGTLEQFEAAVDGGASCAELFDQRGGFDAASDLARIDDLLQAIGCDGPDSERSDR